MSARWVSIACVLAGCGSAVAPAPTTAARSPRNALACAGRSLEDSVPIPELGPLPSGEPVTAGLSITCEPDVVRVLDWGPDSSASYVVERAHAMEVWTAFEAPGTLDERRLAVLLVLARVAP